MRGSRGSRPRPPRGGEHEDRQAGREPAAVPLRRVGQARRGQARRGRGRHLARHRRPRPAHPGAHRRRDARGRARPQHAPVPLVLRDARAAPGHRRLLRATVRREPGSRHRGHPADRLEGGHRAHRGGLRRPGRPRAGGRPRLPRVRHRDDPGGRRAGTAAPDRRATGSFPTTTVSAVPPDTTIMWIGYPSNPTAAVAEVDDPRADRGASRARTTSWRAHDAAYARDHVRRLRRAEHPAGAGREGRRRRVRIAVEDVQHDRVAHRVRRRQRRGHPDARRGEDERRLGDLQRGAAGGDRRADRPAGPRRRRCARCTRSAATWSSRR